MQGGQVGQLWLQGVSELGEEMGKPSGVKCQPKEAIGGQGCWEGGGEEVGQVERMGWKRWGGLREGREEGDGG